MLPVHCIEKHFEKKNKYINLRDFISNFLKVLLFLIFLGTNAKDNP